MRYGTTVSYRDSQAATSTLTVLQQTPGVKHGHKCIAAPRKRSPHKLKRCTRTVALGSVTHRDSAGANRLHLTGRINGHSLKPGTYTLRATASLGQLTSRPLQAKFHIKKAPNKRH